MLCLLEFECTLAGLVQMLENARLLTITNTLCVFHVETTWKHRFNVGYTWCVCREVVYVKGILPFASERRDFLLTCPSKTF